MIKNKEYILCAAIKRREPRTGNNYKTHTTDPDDIYAIEIGRRHNDILERFGKDVYPIQQGFYTSYGRFVDRKEAFEIAKSANQIGDIERTELYSEDLY